MPLLKYIERLERLHFLIKRKSTGTPRELSERLEMSERQLFEYIRDMKDLGAPIKFCKYRQSYYYTKNVKLELGFTEEDILASDKLQIGGGFSMNSYKGSFRTICTRLFEPILLFR